jgi:uncharacterized membrane protein YdbT with pleckstrin-like domain
LNFLLGGVLLLGSLTGVVMSLFMSSKAHGAAAAMGTSMVIVCLAALLLIIWPFIARRATELVITDKRLIAKYGVISTQSIDIRFDKIETVRVKQGLVGRMLNYGEIVVTGTGSTFDPIPNIANPLTFRNELNQAMDPSAK